MAQLPSRAYPGLTLGPTSSYHAGDGTHVHNGQVVASCIGAPSSSSASSSTTASLPTISVLPHDQHPKVGSSSSSSSKPLPSSQPPPRLPRLNSTVLGVVMRVTKDRVTLRLLAVDGAVLTASGGNNLLSDPLGSSSSSSFFSSFSASGSSSSSSSSPYMTGVIRREDIRGWEVDKVVTAEMFHVGDVVRAVVISIGDQAAYYLSTARNELGVLMARAEESGGAGAGPGPGISGGEMGADPGDWMVPVSWREFADPVSGRREGRKVARPV